MRTCDLAWSLWAICYLCSFWPCWGLMLMRGKFCWKMLHFDHGYVRTGASEDRWMVAPICDEWFTTWCGLTLGRVLQVQVAAWFALVQVKSGARKIYAVRGLQGVERHVGLTRGSRWPAGSSAGHMLERKARQSHRLEPMQGSGLRSESAHGVCGGSPQNRQVTWLSHKTKTGGSAGEDGIRARQEASMPADAWRDRRSCVGRWWQWNSVSLAMSLPSVLAWVLYLIHWY
jgi:hypothetical protein